ncbi:MAG: dTDP-4-dehydrorhamnose 3,5-epimerase [Chloroflexota bacterium]|jgi:dTDP-4-dehydrorhamnose 3,5-epimerase|nr:dTDP-4-dehydrorhamnose 3,5-epimerase [Chloroflexota bacterium]
MTADQEIVGLEELESKSSAVNANGTLKHEPIAGVIFRPTRPVAHEDGVVTEIARTVWDELADPVVHVHLTTTLPGRIRAWGLHRASTDRLFVVRGLVSIVLFDGRLASPTYGMLNEFKVSERIPGLLVIPPDLYHGWKNIGIDEAFIINMPTSTYDHDRPDALDLPYDSPRAPEIVPFRW